MSQESIKVLLRIRGGRSFDSGCLQILSNMVKWNDISSSKKFSYDHICNSHVNQEDMYQLSGLPMIDTFIKGYNGTIFAYGQTGSGKTYSMLGSLEDQPNRGIIPRCIETLFTYISTSKSEHTVRCSFLEIYQENIFDLLDAGGTKLNLREDKHRVFVNGLKKVNVASAQEAKNVLLEGWGNREVAETAMNRESSRSHAVFTIYMQTRTKNEDGSITKLVSQFNLVDLAGSERQSNTKISDGVRIKEACGINLSLSHLGNVIIALSKTTEKGVKPFIPYRDSKLCFLLRDSLGGNAKSMMIACAHPDNNYSHETLSTLQFASRVKLIKNAVVLNENTEGDVKQLQETVRQLQQQLRAVTAATTNQSSSSLATTTIAAEAPLGDGITSQCDASNFKEIPAANFYFAMSLYKQAIDKKKLAEEKANNFKKALTLNEKTISQNKMILKFRDESLKMLSKDNDDKFKVAIEGLNNEIQILRKQVDDSPVTQQLQLQIESLKDSNRMVNEHRREDMSSIYERSRHLHDLYNMAERSGELKRASGIEDIQQIQSSHEAVLKEKNELIAKLQADLDNANSENENIKKEHTLTQNKNLELKNKLSSLVHKQENLMSQLRTTQINMKTERSMRISDNLNTSLSRVAGSPMSLKRRRISECGASITTANDDSFSSSVSKNRPATATSSTSSSQREDDQEEEEEINLTDEEFPEFFLDDSIAALNKEITHLQSENTKLFKNLELYKKENTEKTAKLSKLEIESKSNNEMLKEVTDFKIILESELTETKNELELSKSENSDLWIIGNQYEKTIEQHKETIGVVERKLQNSYVNVNKLEVDAAKRMKEHENEVVTLKSEIKEHLEIIANKKEIITSLQDIEEKLKICVHQLESDLKNKNIRIKDNEDEIKELQTLKQQSDILLQERQDNIHSLEDLMAKEKQEHAKEIDNFNEIIVAKDIRISSLEAEEQQLHLKISSLNDTVQKLNDKIEALEDATSKLIRIGEEKTLQINQHLVEIENYKSTIEEINLFNTQISESLSETKQKLNDAESMNNKLICSVKENEILISNHESLIVQLKAEKQELLASNEALNTSIEQINDKLKAREDEIIHLQSTQEHLNILSQSRLDKIASLENDLSIEKEKQRVELEKLNKTIDSYNEEIIMIKGENIELNTLNLKINDSLLESKNVIKTMEEDKAKLLDQEKENNIKISEFKTKISNIKVTIEQLNQTIEENRIYIQECHDNRDAFRLKIDECMEELAEGKLLIKGFEEIMNNLSSEKTDLEMLNNKLNKSLLDNEEKLQVSENKNMNFITSEKNKIQEIEILKTLIKNLEIEIGTYKTTILECNQRIEQQQNDLSNASMEKQKNLILYENLQKENIETQNKLKLVIDEMTIVQSTYDLNCQQLADLRVTILEQKNSLENRETDLIQHQQLLSDVNNENKEFKVKLEEQEITLQNIYKDYQEKQESLIEVNSKLEENEKEMLEKMEKINSLENTKNQLNSAVERINNCMYDIKSQLHASDNENQSLKLKHEEFTQKIGENMEHIETQKIKIEELVLNNSTNINIIKMHEENINRFQVSNEEMKLSNMQINPCLSESENKLLASENENFKLISRGKENEILLKDHKSKIEELKNCINQLKEDKGFAIVTKNENSVDVLKENRVVTPGKENKY